MIRMGMIDEGLSIVENTRKRYRGYNRNPWTIDEEGSALNLSAWDVHLALSGLRYRLEERMMTLDPQISREDFSCIWTAPAGWGRIRISGSSIDLEVYGGELELNEIQVPAAYSYKSAEIHIVQGRDGFREESSGGRTLKWTEGSAGIEREGEVLRILLEGIPELNSGDKLQLEFRQ
jgi:hypothetical protein